LTVTPGTVAAGSLVYVYGYVTSANVFRFMAVVPAGATYAAGGTTPCDIFQNRVCTGAPTTTLQLSQILSQGSYLWVWTVDATGQFNVSGGTAQRRGGDAWISSLTVANVTAGAITLTSAAAGGDTLPLQTAVSLPANSTSVLNWNDAVFVEQGLTLLASGVSSLTARVTGYRLPVLPTIPPPPGV
jgi:hypothetical protein